MLSRQIFGCIYIRLYPATACVSFLTCSYTKASMPTSSHWICRVFGAPTFADRWEAQLVCPLVECTL